MPMQAIRHQKRSKTSDNERRQGVQEKKKLTYLTLLDGVKMSNTIHGEKTLMARFKLEKGCVIPDHSHPYEQTGLLLWEI